MKNCPKGTELYSPLCGECKLYDVNDYTIRIETPNKDTLISLYHDGRYCSNGEIMLFPKDKTTWKGFVPPCEFKDGDVVATWSGDWIGITTGGQKCKFMPTYCVIKNYGKFEAYLDKKETWQFHRLATEKEKQKLFQAIKDNGYKWNAETKTLEKLVEPKFKIGDRVRNKNYKDYIYDIHDITDKGYRAKEINADSPIIILFGSQEDNYELVPNKFDVINFEPFMEVLVRSDNSDVWECDFFSSYNPKCSNRFHCIGAWYDICIPYIGNEHLLGTTNDCDEYYKTWE